MDIDDDMYGLVGDPPPAATTTKLGGPWGQVRATPYGSCLDRYQDPDPDSMNGKSPLQWNQWRKDHLKPLVVPREGFGHVYGQDILDQVDKNDLAGGSSKKSKGNNNNNSKIHHKIKIKGDGYALDENVDNDDDDLSSSSSASPTGHLKDSYYYDFGSTKTPDDAPVASLKDKWRLLPHFLRLRSLMRQHIDSFDHFINVELNKIVQSESARVIRSDSDPNWFLKFTKCWVGEPKFREDSFDELETMTPFQCRLRDTTYSAPVFVSIEYIRGRNIVKATKEIGRMPIMLRSQKCILRGKSESELAALKECPHDPGGYFIIKGVEKVILIQEQLSKNRVILEEDSKGQISASIQSFTKEKKTKAYIIIKHGKFYLKNNILGDDVPIMIILKAMGIESDMEAVQLVGSEPDIANALALSMEESNKAGVHTELQALKYIGTRISRRDSTGYRAQIPPEDAARDILTNTVLNHVPVEHYELRPKAIYVANIVRRVLLVKLGKLSLDDKDYYGNKRLQLAGELLSLLFEDQFKLFMSNLKKLAEQVLSKPNKAQAFDVAKNIRPDSITNGMANTISTGNWNIKRFRMDKQGVTQVLTRLSYMSALGVLTNIHSQFEKTRKVSGPRSLQPSQWGMLCPADTPEGEACGLTKNLALLAHITMEEETLPVERLCKDLGVEDVLRLSGHEINSEKAYMIFLNGLILGVHTRPKMLVRNLRLLRRRGLTGEFVSFYLNDEQRAVHIATDGGRVCRPLIIVDDETGLPLLKQWHIESLALGMMNISDLLKRGIVEYVDCNEENNTLIAVTEKDLEIARKQGLDNLKMKYTHMEVDPFTILGVVGGIIPYPHHNQAPRNTYTVAMAKQAMGNIGLNQYERMDGLIYTLVYPQKPLVKSRALDLINFDDLPGGQNSVIAVMSYSGYDIEDAIVLNKASIDRGFGRCMVFRKYQTSIKSYPNGLFDRSKGPPSPSQFAKGEKDKRYAKFSALDEDGICQPGEEMEPGKIMVNKDSPMVTTNTGGENPLGPDPRTAPYKSSPLIYRNAAPSYVDKVIMTSNQNEQRLIKVMLRQVRRPEIGDKFASRHGQKGVCGLIVPQEDLPFNEAGHPPDLIMNPHGFPSRMTVGKLLELLVSKSGVYEGRQGYSSAFGEEHGSADTAEATAQALIRNGMNYAGKDVFYSGASGEPLDAYVFSGPVFYQKLKHMVLDKLHARARGPRAVLTRQPTEGRSRDGGLRLGEMERDCLIAYGASNLIMERLMKSSDEFCASVCTGCGLIVEKNWCQYCRSGESVREMKLPYACKLLFQELQSMNVLPKLKLQDA